MGNYRLVVLSNPAEGHDDEYNDWYTNNHLPDVIAIPGIIAAQRFKFQGSVTAPEAAPTFQYMAIYDIETNDLDATIRELQARPGTSAMPISDAIDINGASGSVYEVITPRIESTTP